MVKEFEDAAFNAPLKKRWDQLRPILATISSSSKKKRRKRLLVFSEVRDKIVDQIKRNQRLTNG